MEATGEAPASVPSSLGPTPPSEVEVFDIPDDDGTNLGVLFRWMYATTDNTTVSVKVHAANDILDAYRLTEAEQQRLDSALEQLKADLAPYLPEQARLQGELDAAQTEYNKAKNNKEATMFDLGRAYFAKLREMEDLTHKMDKANDRFLSRTKCKCRDRQVTDLRLKDRYFRFLEATLSADDGWMDSDVSGLAPADIPTKANFPALFGHDPEEADKLFLQVHQVVAMNPDVLAGNYAGAPDDTGVIVPANIMVNLQKNHMYDLRMVTAEGADLPVTSADLGSAKTAVNYFRIAVLNNFIFAIVFSIIIMVGIMMARRNPNLFIRRIQGLEAVDEAIGRATEMGKPVLYLCGMDALAGLNTLAAINVLGRVARRIADYDSDLIVPCRDPVVLTVAQEVVKEAYIDQGRPDAFREDKIYFLTDDQFAFTASVCGIMMREKPAAHFFMGGYYAESLLLAETGSTTGAIQIAGTDSLNQLPFFITACDYTLIGEELYAASAYLSREPLLLGSLKGQDVGKALIMILIIVQTLLFVVAAIMQKMNIEPSGLDFLKMIVEPL